MDDDDMDLEFESGDSDEDTELDDIKQLTAVLEADNDVRSETQTVQSCSTSWVGTSAYVSQKSSLYNTESALALNNLYHEKLKRLESLLVNRLHECRKRLQDTQNVINNIASGTKQEVFRYIQCGKPYFRDKLNFSAPDNEDTIMIKSQMYNFSIFLSVPGWTVKDKSSFMNEIHKMSKVLKRDELNFKIQMLKKSSPRNSSKIHKAITSLQSEIAKLDKKPLSQLALPLDKDYDWDCLANKLKRRHTANEYQALWKLFFHPSINKNSWSKAEHNSLITIASANSYQDWDHIAQSLNTGRTGYQCFVYHRTNMTTTFNGKRWTLEETAYLKRLIDYYQEDNYIPWSKIAAAMGNRTKMQIYNKYLRLLEFRKGRFLPAEDAVILNCVNKFGTNFKRMTHYLPGRSMIQVRARYNVLNNMRISTIWSVEDDKKLIQIMTNQNTNHNFSLATKYFPGRTRTHLRARYVTLLKWMKGNPHMDLELAPRRAARRLNHGHATEGLNEAIENLKNTLNNEVKTKKSKKRVSLNSTDVEIEDSIIANLITEMFHSGDDINSQVSTMEDSEEVNVTNLTKCLIFLGSKLDAEKFRSSQYAMQYPGLVKSFSPTVQVRSYSRKNLTNTIVLDKNPDIWQHTLPVPRAYVLPPHYATITGCKALMSHVSKNVAACTCVDVHALARRNSLVKQQFSTLLERFYILFVWPMLLSNENPAAFAKLKRLINSD